MSIAASYGVIDYIKSIWNPAIAPDTINFHPGRWSPTGTDNTYAIYKVMPNLDYEQPYIHVDNLRIVLYHTSFDMLSRLCSLLLKKLNNESVSDNPALYQAGLNELVRYQDIVARVHSTDHNEFIDSSEFFSAVIDIMIQYIELPGPHPGMSGFGMMITGSD